MHNQKGFAATSIYLDGIAMLFTIF